MSKARTCRADDRFGIMNHVGSIWTPETYDIGEAAQAKLNRERETWAQQGWDDLSRHRVEPVRVTVSPKDKR